jgi:hypothetical protein
MTEDAEKVARNNALFRDANERIESAAADADLGVDNPIPFICECSDRACTTLIRLSLDDYRRVRSNSRWFAHAPGHEESLDGAVRPLEQHGAYVLVEKVGRAGEITQALAETKDPG